MSNYLGVFLLVIFLLVSGLWMNPFSQQYLINAAVKIGGPMRLFLLTLLLVFALTPWIILWKTS